MTDATLSGPVPSLAVGRLLTDGRLRATLAVVWLAAWCVIGVKSLTPMPDMPFDLDDTLVHFGVYGGMGLAAASFAHKGRELALCVGLAMLLGGLFEFGQRYIPGRVSDPVDMAANITGAVGGAILGLVWLHYGLRPLTRPAISPSR